MTRFKEISQVAMDIKGIAQEALKRLPSSDSSFKAAKRSIGSPIDYMRHAEFEAILRDLQLEPGMKILDISSPQWFSLYLANRYPECTFDYINILDSELMPFQKIAHCVGIRNIHYHRGDVRELEFGQGVFDKVISISVIEHIYPEKGGDVRALTEVHRVLNRDGEFLLTIPYKSKSNIVYVDGSVYERGERKKNFFAREYDRDMFDTLVKGSGFVNKYSWFICEKKGLFAPDYYEWGPGKKNLVMRYLIKSRKIPERVLGISLDAMLAKHYLSISRELTNRVVNISAVLRKARSSV